ncbi:hypothetical protein MAUB1S_11246 [Mycolicibacterium aubagnense]
MIWLGWRWLDFCIGIVVKSVGFGRIRLENAAGNCDLRISRL